MTTHIGLIATVILMEIIKAVCAAWGHPIPADYLQSYNFLQLGIASMANIPVAVGWKNEPTPPTLHP